MKRIILYLLLTASACFGAATYYVDSGSMSFGSGRGSLANQITVTLSGAPSSQQRIFNYFDFSGELNISLPPAVTGTCTGAPCNIFTTDASTSGVYNVALGNAPISSTPYNYGVDAVYASTSAGCSTATAAPLGNTVPFNWPVSGDLVTVELGNKISADSAGYICAIRFLKPSSDTNTSHTVHLWDSSNNSVATATTSSEAASGWITVPITPTAIPAKTVYTASYSAVNTHAYYILWLGQNASPHNGPIRIVGFYGGSNGACDVTDKWPTNPDGLAAAGIVGCADIKTDGTLADAYSPDNGYGQFNLGYSQWNNVEGCQCMIGGVGPGPYALINTRIEGSGNKWHHDDSGAWWSDRGDYYYYRDTFTSPTYTWLGSPDSDGNRYYSRQTLEWKAGHRIYIGGSVFENFWNDVSNSSLAIAFSNLGVGVHDINFEYNELRHGPGGFFAANGVYGVNGNLAAPPAVRERFAHNLMWDIGPYAVKGASSGNGWFMEGIGGAEDLILDHNTILPMRGQIGAILWMMNQRSEGISITNNILPISSAYRGFSGEHNCPQRNAEAAINCLWENYTFKNNVLYPAAWSVFDPNGNAIGGVPNQTYSSNTQPADVASWYPTISQSNYVPQSTDLSTMRWFKLNSFPSDSLHMATSGNFHLRSNSSYISGGPYKGTDGKDVGIDADAFESAQGTVVLVGNQITASSATVAFVTPDAQTCPVDYKVYDATDPNLIHGFTRISDTGTSRIRNVSLGNLSSKTTYMYRVNCAVQQPTGQFRTN